MERDKKKELKLLHKQAQSGDPKAQCEYGCMLRNEHPVFAVNWFHKSAKQGFSDAYVQLFHMYYNGWGTRMNQHKALDFLKTAVEVGNVEAHLILGFGYLSGRYSCEKDIIKSAELYNYAANKGNMEAAYWLGNIYKNYIKNESESMKWYTVAAENGYVEAQKTLAMHYYYSSDQEKAFRLYKMAAEQGDFDSALKLGEMYYDGVGTEKNYREAVKWIEKNVSFYAYDKKYSGFNEFIADYAYILGNMYLFGGYGLDIDVSKAIHHYENAVKWTDHEGSKEALYKCYSEGIGVPKDINKAYESQHYYEKNEFKGSLKKPKPIKYTGTFVYSMEDIERINAKTQEHLDKMLGVQKTPKPDYIIVPKIDTSDL